MSLRKDKIALTRKTEIHFSDQVLYEQAIIVACIVGIAVTLLWSSAGRIEEEPFSVLYLVPDSYDNYIAGDELVFRYGIDSFEDGETEYRLSIYRNGELLSQKKKTLAYGETLEEDYRIEFSPQTRFPANISLTLTDGEKDYHVHFWVYRTPPGIDVDYPPNDTVTNQGEVTVRGTAQRGANLSVNGEFITDEGGPFTTNVTLTQGENIITIAATDALGNTTIVERQITLDRDVAVAIVDPKTNISTRQEHYTVRGRALEPVTAAINGDNISVTDGIFEKNISLKEGKNTVSIRAVDTAGNVFEQTIIITKDTAATLTITHPEPGQTVGGRYVVVNGSAEENSVVVINGVEVYTGASGSFSTNVELIDNVNTITVGSIDQAGNVVEKTISITRDTLPPDIINLGPRGVQAATRIVLTASTDEPADCRYAQTQQPYDTMQQAFTTGQKTKEHYTPVDVESGETTFYVSCEDIYGNQMQVAESITVSVGGGVPIASDLSPEGTVSSRSQRLRVSTDEEATCKYDNQEKAYDNMAHVFSSTGGTHHTTEVTGLADGQHTFYVRCKSLNTGIAMTSSARIQFSVDSSAPTIESHTPTGTVTSQTTRISVTTNEAATCRADTEGVAYSNMQYLFEGDDRGHRLDVTLNEGGNTFYVVCRDDEGNEMRSPYTLQITVDSQPPITSNPLPQGTVSSPTQTISVVTDEPARCAWALEDAPMADMTLFSTTGETTNHYTLVTADDGVNTYFVRCEDEHGNEMTSSTLIQFTVQ